MKVKKLVAVVLILSLLFLLGCGSKKEENEGAAEKTKTENKTATKATASGTDQPVQSNGSGEEESRIIVNGEPVPELMWEAELESASYNTGKGKDAPETLKLAMRLAISHMIDMQMGKKYGIYPTPEEIKKIVEAPDESGDLPRNEREKKIKELLTPAMVCVHRLINQMGTAKYSQAFDEEVRNAKIEIRDEKLRPLFSKEILLSNGRAEG